jgi:hypothetical protein
MSGSSPAVAPCRSFCLSWANGWAVRLIVTFGLARW